MKLNLGESQNYTHQSLIVIGCDNTKIVCSKPKRSAPASAPKQKGTNTKKPSSSSGTNKTFKEQVDAYFVLKYPQLESTTQKIITKYNRTFEPSAVISSTYIYIISKEPEIIHFSRTFSKSIEHTIYSFVLKYINNSLIWSDSPMYRELNKFINNTINIDDENFDQASIKKTTSYQSNIYTEDFIEQFYQSLNKIDRISFYAFYFEGVDNTKDFAQKFNISTSSAYTTINILKKLLKDFIAKNKIE